MTWKLTDGLYGREDPRPASAGHGQQEPQFGGLVDNHNLALVGRGSAHGYSYPCPASPIPTFTALKLDRPRVIAKWGYLPIPSKLSASFRASVSRVETGQYSLVPARRRRRARSSQRRREDRQRTSRRRCETLTRGSVAGEMMGTGVRVRGQ